MSSFSKNVLKLSTGDFLAQLISIGAIPVITRIYSPIEYGHFSIFFSVTMMLFPISSLQYHAAIMLPTDRKEAINIMGLALLSVVIFSILTAGAIWLLSESDLISQNWSWLITSGYCWFIPVGVLILGCAYVFVYWTIREKKFNNLALSRVTESVIDRSITLTAGFLSNAGTLGLIAGRIVGPFVTLCYLAYAVAKHDIWHIWKTLGEKETFRLAVKYRNFPLYSTFSIFCNSAARELPVLVLAAFFSPVVTGFYALGLRVLNMPMLVIGDSISKVFFQKACEDRGEVDRLATGASRLFGYLIYLSLPFILILVVYGKEIFQIVFGSAWTEAGVYAQILGLSFLAMFLYRPISVLFDVYERQRAKLLFNINLFLFRTLAVLAGAYFAESPYIALIAMAATTIVLYAIAYMFLFSLMGVRPGRLLKIVVTKCFVLGPFIVLLPFTKFLFNGNYVLITGTVVALVLLQATIIVFTDSYLKNMLHFRTTG